MLFSLSFIVGGIFVRMLFSFFCLKEVMGSFFPPKNDPSRELYNAMEFAQVPPPFPPPIAPPPPSDSGMAFE